MQRSRMEKVRNNFDRKISRNEVDIKEQINRCWLYLQVSRASDMSSADGRHLQETWINPNNEKESFSKTCWLIMPKQSERTWQIWKTALRRLTDGQERWQVQKEAARRVIEHRFLYSAQEEWLYERTAIEYRSRKVIE